MLRGRIRPLPLRGALARCRTSRGRSLNLPPPPSDNPHDGPEDSGLGNPGWEHLSVSQSSEGSEQRRPEQASRDGAASAKVGRVGELYERSAAGSARTADIESIVMVLLAGTTPCSCSEGFPGYSARAS